MISVFNKLNNKNFWIPLNDREKIDVEIVNIKVFSYVNGLNLISFLCDSTICVGEIDNEKKDIFFNSFKDIELINIDQNGDECTVIEIKVKNKEY